MQTVKIISLNVALFEANNHAIGPYLRTEKADILCLQEVTRAMDGNTKEEYISLDAINTACRNLSYTFFAPNWIMKDFRMKDFHGSADFNVDFNGFLELGNCIKSRFPIQKGQGIFLQNHYTYATDWSNWRNDESRSVQITDVLLEGGKQLRIFNYHGIWSRDKIGNENTSAACERIREIALQTKGPVIICGDFNLFPHTESMKLLNDSFISLGDRFKVKTTRPQSNELNGQTRNVVDYMFISRDIEIVDFKVVDNDVSDHLPLVLTCRI